MKRFITYTKLSVLFLFVSYLWARPLGKNLKPEETLKRLNVHFVENRGQLPEEILFSAFPGKIYILKDRIVVNGTEIIFKGIERNVKVQGIDKKTAKFSYFKGNNPEKWKRKVPSYEKVEYKNIYRGVDLIFSGLKEGRIEFQWVISTNASPEKIKFEIKNAQTQFENGEVKVFNEGKLLFVINEIKAFQGAERVKVGIKKEGDTYSYILGRYSPQYPLVIDPDLDSLFASTYLGGIDEDWGYSISVDGSGNVVLSGYTYSTDFPAISGYDTTFNGYCDAFVVKLNPDLSSLIAATFLGGSYSDKCYSLYVDSSDNVFVTGRTSSSDFPIVNGYDSSYNGNDDAFVAKFNADLTSLLASTFLGGNSYDYGFSIYGNGSNAIYVTGATYSQNFPALGGYDTTFNIGWDAFVAKFDGDLSSLISSTFLGGNSDEDGRSLYVDGSGNVFLTGYTNSWDFPVVNGYGQSINGWRDTYVAKFDGNLSTLLGSTYLGGSNNDEGFSIFVNDLGEVYLTGYTESPNFPAVNGYDTSFGDSSDVFVAKFTSNLDSLSASTFLGGNSVEWGYSLSVDHSGYVYVTGYTGSSDFPIVNGYDSTHNGYWDVFIAKLDGNLNSLVASTFLGGSNRDRAISIFVDESGNAFITGETYSDEFPIVGGFDTSYHGSDDAFVAKFNASLVKVSEPLESRSQNQSFIRRNAIFFDLREPSYVGISIYREDGRVLDKISCGYMTKGTHIVNLDYLKRGVYLLKMRIGDEVKNAKFIKF